MWAVPIEFLVAVSTGVRSVPFDSGYQVAYFASTSSLLIVVAPLHLMFAGLVFRRVPAIVRDLRSVRSFTVVGLVPMFPLLLGGPLSGALAMVIVWGGLPSSWQAWSIVGVVSVTLLAAGLVGVGLAWSLPSFAALPLGAIGCFSWLAFPGSYEVVLLRHLNSGFVGCCANSTEPAPAMIWGSAALGLTVCIGVIGLFVWSSRVPLASGIVLLGLIATLGLGFVTSVAAVRQHEPLTLLAVRDRTSPVSCSSGDEPRVCVWPENESRLGTVASVSATFADGLAVGGLRVPATISERGSTNGKTIQFVAASYVTDEDMRYSMAVGYVDLLASCGRTYEPIPYELAISYVALAGGISESALERRVATRSVVAEAQSARAAGAQQQPLWLSSLIESSRCRADS